MTLPSSIGLFSGIRRGTVCTCVLVDPALFRDLHWSATTTTWTWHYLLQLFFAYSSVRTDTPSLFFISKNWFWENNGRSIWSWSLFWIMNRTSWIEFASLGIESNHEFKFKSQNSIPSKDNLSTLRWTWKFEISTSEKFAEFQKRCGSIFRPTGLYVYLKKIYETIFRN